MASITEPAGRLRPPPMGVPLLEDLPSLSGKSVLVRATLDLPLAPRSGSPAARQRAALLTATLFHLARRARRVIVYGDRGRGAGGPPLIQEKAIAQLLSQGAPYGARAWPSDCGEDEAAVELLVAGHDVFVNDSFHWSHLPFPSVMIPPVRLPAAAGRSLEHDLRIAEDLLHRARRPVVAVIGGADPLPRLHGLEGLVLRADEVLVGGAVSQPMLVAIGREHGDDSGDFSSECRSLFGLAQRVQHPIHLPQDLVVTDPDAGVRTVPATGDIPGRVEDIGPATAKRFFEIVEGAATVLWTGSLGRVEDPRFSSGTVTVARALRAGRPEMVVLAGDALTTAVVARDACGPDALMGVRVATATLPLLEILRGGDLPSLQALRAGVLETGRARLPGPAA